MALNYLYHREQVSLARAESAASPEARSAHRGLAKGYAARIATMRSANGANGYGMATRCA